MRRNSRFLAAYGPPSAAMTEYSAEDLGDPERVEVLFDYCQILQAVISAAGWRCLLQKHGLAGLLEIDCRSGWLDADASAAADALKYQCLIAGYDPENDAFGAYDETIGIFVDEHGGERTIRWAVPWLPAVQARGQ